MNGPAELARPRPGLATREAGLLLIAAAGAWAATVALARGMTGMTGTMGLGLAVFVPAWTLMMTAMGSRAAGAEKAVRKRCRTARRRQA